MCDDINGAVAVAVAVLFLFLFFGCFCGVDRVASCVASLPLSLCAPFAPHKRLNLALVLHVAVTGSGTSSDGELQRQLQVAEDRIEQLESELSSVSEVLQGM